MYQIKVGTDGALIPAPKTHSSAQLSDSRMVSSTEKTAEAEKRSKYGRVTTYPVLIV